MSHSNCAMQNDAKFGKDQTLYVSKNVLEHLSGKVVDGL